MTHASYDFNSDAGISGRKKSYGSGSGLALSRTIDKDCTINMSLSVVIAEEDGLCNVGVGDYCHLCKVFSRSLAAE